MNHFHHKKNKKLCIFSGKILLAMTLQIEHFQNTYATWTPFQYLMTVHVKKIYHILNVVVVK